MISIGKIAFFIVLLNMLGIGLLVFYTTNRGTAATAQPSSLPSETLSTSYAPNTKKSYKFDDPLMAWHILNELDPFQPLPDMYLKMIDSKKAHLGLKRDDKYCIKSRAYLADHADYIFLQKNFLVDYTYSSLPRKLVTQKIGRELQPNISYGLPKNVANETLFDLMPNFNSIFINAGLHGNYYLGKHFGCSHQLYNHIPGVTSLNAKGRVSDIYQKYKDSYSDRPDCIPNFMPESYILKNKTQCEAFFEYFQSKEYKKLTDKYNVLFVKKLGFGSHRGEGVFVLNRTEEDSLNDEYDGGKKCGNVTTNYQMQQYIYNPLLVSAKGKDYKFDFRIYMLIASTNPLILYYHDGFLRVSLCAYDPFSEEKCAHLTNTDISKSIFKETGNGTYNGMTQEELRNFQMWNFTKLQDYLYETGKIQDKTWLDTGLRYQIQQSMAHIGRMTRFNFLNRSNIYELFGIDFILDNDLKLWFIECNSGPVLEGTSKEKELFISKMLLDHFDIMFGYLRSRMKRIVLYVNEITHTIPEENIYPDGVVIPNKAAAVETFKKLDQNYMEPEYEVSPDNGFKKIIDDNLKGEPRYAGYIKEHCIDNDQV
jgi:hypothetical protein